jgi:autotransporter-associated beta strand protein/YVTN family beta-propeller protein
LLLGNVWLGALLISAGGEARAQAGPFMYVPSPNDNTVSVVDISTNTVVATIPIISGGYFPAVRGDQSVVYVSNYANNTVTPINTATNTPGAPIAVGVNPYGLAITPDGTKVYVANNSGTTVSVISTATNTVVATIGGFTTPTDVIVTPDGKTAYVTNQTANSVTPINIATNTAGPAIPLAPGANPFFLTVTPNGATVYVANSANGTVTPITTATNTAGAPIVIGGTPTQAIATPNGQTIYVSNQSGVVVISTATNTVVATIPIATSFGLAVSPDGTTVYVADIGGNTVTPIDTATNTLGAPIVVGANPQFPGICSNGNALLATGLIFKANTSGALGCTLASGPSGSAGPVFTGGTMQFAAANISSALPITLMAAGGTFDTAGNNATLSGAITGAGGLTKIGLGTLTLSGAGTYLGPTAVNAGTLQAGAAGAFSPNSAYSVASGAILNLNGFNQIIGSLTGPGNVTLGSATLTTGNDDTSTTYSGAISGAGGLTKSGTGTFTLSGINAYGGATNVNAGTLTIAAGGSIVSAATVNNGGRFLVNGASAGVIVNTGGTLGGTGTVGNTTINGGTLSPGNGIGAITVAGSLVMSTAASYLVEVSPTAADRTNVTGTATVTGTVNAMFTAGSYMVRSYTILSANGGRTGTFGTLATTNLPSGFSANLSYTATDVLLNLAAALGQGSPGGLSGNQQNVASAINAFFNNGGALPPGFVTVFGLTGDSLRNALTQLSGEAATGSHQTTFNAMGLFMGLLTDPFVAGRGDGATGGAGASAFAEESDGASAYAANGKPRDKNERDAYAAIYRKAPPIAEPFAQCWSVWAAGFGGTQTTDGNAVVGSNTATSRVYGTAVGADYRISPFTVAGFALAGGGTNFSIANGLGNGRSDLFQAGAFVRHNVGPAYISAALAYGWQDITIDRTVTIAGIDQLRAKFNANAWSGRVEGGYRLAAQGFGLTPYAAGQFTTFELPNYAEAVVSGANTFALAYAAKSVTATRSELGLRTDKSFAMPNGIFTLRGRLAWAHDFNPDRSIAATFQTLPGASFVVNGAAQARDAALTTASAEMKWRNGWSAAGTFEGEFSNVTRSYAGKGVVRYAW